MIPEVDKYLQDGCMRCEYGATPKCKVNSWREELTTLRMIVLETGLREELKWGVPCYTFQKKNVLTVSALKNSATLSFFKGSLLSDPENLLQKPGENSQAARYLKFTDVSQIIDTEHIIKEFIEEAIELEKANKQVQFKKNPEPIPSELEQKFEEDPAYKEAFEALTPGRQRSYILHISGAKQEKTRVSRIEKCRDKVFSGKGFNEY